MEEKIIDLNSFANGALSERCNTDIQKILENIADPNTDAKKVRKLTVTISFHADNERDVVVTSVVSKPTLAPAKPIESKLMMDLDSRGKVTGAELKSGIKGQTFMDDHGDVADDQGNKIINLKKQSN